jgi:Meiotically up-regulated gene 113
MFYLAAPLLCGPGFRMRHLAAYLGRRLVLSETLIDDLPQKIVAGTYQTGDPHRAYRIVAEWNVADREKAETAIHRALSDLRFDCEWYRNDPRLIERIEAVIAEIGG